MQQYPEEKLKLYSPSILLAILFQTGASMLVDGQYLPSERMDLMNTWSPVDFYLPGTDTIKSEAHAKVREESH